ncbi:hypothetical protein [Actinomycetospora sp. TBRC 11914]|uniref:hypothetical protein n=1 Tax=Actinomycetospora sp. TBRC 11914 TaxID=2729387 RepID=UPI00145EAEA6|nr:hypothetical protein [Actinomycetospora sp. TBRC 11914]NMO90341.1 hypothetical protein [Actinomycetospora sp. TBRC 11914]
MAIELADDPRYRPIVERLPDAPPDVAEAYSITISSSGEKLESGALACWFDTLAARPLWEHEADRLLSLRTATILAHRRDHAISHLMKPGRGPPVYWSWAAAAVMRAIERVPAIEAAWLQWNRDDRFTKRLDRRSPFTLETGRKATSQAR